MDKNLIIFVSSVFLNAFLISCNKLPDYITPCSRNETNLEDCILTEGRKVLKQFSTGNPELGVDPLDPLYLGTLKVSKRRKSGLGVELTDCYFHGLGKADLHNITVNFKGGRNFIKFSTNHTSIRGHYKIDGQILVIPIKGEGNISIKIKYTLCEYVYNFTTYTDDKGLQHGNITTDDLQCDIGKSTFKLDNLFGGNKELGDNINNILNTSFHEELMKDMSPPVLDAIRRGVKRRINDFYASVSIDDIFPMERIMADE